MATLTTSLKRCALCSVCPASESLSDASAPPQQPDVVILATSILSMEAVLGSFPVQRLRRSTLVVDVLSVKARGLSGTRHYDAEWVSSQEHVLTWRVCASVARCFRRTCC